MAQVLNQRFNFHIHWQNKRGLSQFHGHYSRLTTAEYGSRNGQYQINFTVPFSCVTHGCFNACKFAVI